MASEAVDVTQLGGDLVPGEGVRELGVSRELLGRLRELEAENSALALANENQREAYERCLDEVANHVVQALLNQKDLREECLKLKKKVLDLERQNRTLSDLFNQKLHLSSGAPPQLQARLQQAASDSQLGAAEKHQVSPSVGLCTSQGSRERPRGASPASPSLDALSPFLKKKAQILEVLRKLEEADPLLVCPSSYPPLAGHGDFSLQWKAEHRWELSAASPGCVPAEGVAPALPQGPEPWASRLLVAQSSLEDLLRWKMVGCGTASESLQAEEVEEGGMLNPGRGGCGDMEPTEMELLPPHCCHDLSGPSSSSSSDDSGEQERGDLRALEKGSPALLLSSINRKEDKDILQDTEPYLSVVIDNGTRSGPNGNQAIADVAGGRRRDSESRRPKDGLSNASLSSLSKALEREVLQQLSRVGKSQQAQGNECSSHITQEPVDGNPEPGNKIPVWEEVEKLAQNSQSICSHMVKPQEKALSETPNHKQTFTSTYISSGCLGAPQEPEDPAYKSVAGSLNLTTSLENSNLTPSLDSSPHHGEPRPIPMPSPSKIIKFLKIPSERTQSPNHLRLSPQLTRSSKIPCRNNYEVYHSPVPSRRACRAEDASRCAGKSQMALDGEPTAAFSVNSPGGGGTPGQYSPVYTQSAGANPSDPFSRQVPRMPNYENISELTGHDSTSGMAKLELPVLCPHLVQHLIQPVREMEASEPQQPVGFSLPANSQAPVQKGSQGEGTGQCISGSSPCPSTTEQNPEPKLPESSSTSLHAMPVGTKGTSPAHKKSDSGKLLESPAGHLPFQVRLTALGKLKSVESPQPMALSQAAGKEDPCGDKETLVTANNQRNRVMVARPCEMSEIPLDSTPEAHVYLKRSLGSKSLKQAEVCVNGEPRVKCYQSNSVGSRAEADNYSSKSDHCSRHRIPPGSPQAPRSSGRPPGAGNASKHARSPHGSPTKLLAKSPLKTSVPRVPLNEEPKPCIPPAMPLIIPTPEEKLKVQHFSMSRRSMTCPEYAVRTPPAPRSVDKLPLSSTLHSAIEEKVMKGIEENMLRLQVQDRVPVVEVKQKNSSGIASWFGLKKSKLPALNRRPDTFKGKEEKRGVASASPRKEGRAAAKKLEVESLNISMLMEKAEDLRKALEAEKVYMKSRSAERTRAHPGGIIVEQTQSELKVIYSKEVTPDNFMRQLLNRVDGKDIVYENPLDLKNQLPDFSRATRESKDPPTFRSQRNGMVSHLQHCEETPDQTEDGNICEEIPSDDSLTESVTSQHFTVCGSLTRTLDSGIGTFPPPDYCCGTPSRSVPRLKPGVESAPIAPAGRPPVLLKLPRKARTLEREAPSMEEALVPGQHHSVPAFHALLANPEPALGQRGRSVGKDPRLSPAQSQRAQQGKNWTFPNAKAAASSTDTLLSSSRELEVLRGSARGPADGRMDCDLPNLTPRTPLDFPGSIASRTPSASDVGEEGAMDLKSRGVAQLGLESSESLSDSLYDSLSSCGSQG